MVGAAIDVGSKIEPIWESLQAPTLRHYSPIRIDPTKRIEARIGAVVNKPACGCSILTSWLKMHGSHQVELNETDGA